MRRQKIRLYCNNCKQTVSAELLPEYALCQTDKEVALKQYARVVCPSCDAEFSMPRLFDKLAQQLKAQMALGEVAYDFACSEIRKELVEKGYSGETLRKLTAECVSVTEWDNFFIMQHDIPWIVEAFLRRTGRTQEEAG